MPKNSNNFSNHQNNPRELKIAKNTSKGNALGFKRAIIRVNPANEASIKVPIRCGFVEEGEIITKDLIGLITIILGVIGISYFY